MNSTTITDPRATSDTYTVGAGTKGGPLAGIPLIRLVRVEWSKATDTRAARWLLVAVALSTGGLMLAPLLSPSSIEQSYTSYLGFAAIALSLLLPVVAILTLTSEWSQRTALTTFTQEPRRTRVIGAKIAVSLLLGVGAAAFGVVVTVAALALAAASGRSLDSGFAPGLLVAFLLYVVLNVMTGVALGALVHNSAAAIVTSFVLPLSFGLLGRASSWVASWLDYSTAFTWLLHGEWSAHGSQILTSVAVWVVLPLTAGLVRTARREIG